MSVFYMYVFIINENDGVERVVYVMARPLVVSYVPVLKQTVLVALSALEEWSLL